MLLTATASFWSEAGRKDEYSRPMQRELKKE
jgi:hypothetical protein